MGLSSDIMRFIAHAGFVLFFAGMVASCGSLVEIVPEFKLDNNESKLVVHAYLSPHDTLLKVYVTQSIPVFKEEGPSGAYTVVTDAVVVLSDAGKEVVLPYDSAYSAYSVNADEIGGIRAGATYRLRVKDSKRSAEAETTVPSAPPAIASYQVDTSYSSFGDFYGRKDTSITVQFTWKDSPGIGNYYRVAGKSLILTDYQELDTAGKRVIRRGRVTMPLHWDGTFGGSEFQSDANSDGRVMQSPLARISLRRPVFLTENGAETGSVPEVKNITLNLLHTDEHYYRYHQSARDHDIAGDNPFAEPVLLYSNVRGGLGVFGSFNSFSIDIKP